MNTNQRLSQEHAAAPEPIIDQYPVDVPIMAELKNPRLTAF